MIHEAGSPKVENEEKHKFGGTDRIPSNDGGEEYIGAAARIPATCEVVESY